jgi:hypothetical protein
MSSLALPSFRRVRTMFNSRGCSPSADVDLAFEVGDKGTLYSYYEYFYGLTNTERCAWLDPVARGSSHLFTVYRRLQAQVGNNQTWQVNIDSQPVDSNVYTGDEAMSAAAGSGELIQDLQAPLQYPDGTVYGCFGCKTTPVGLWHWQWTSSAGASGWNDVTSAVEMTSATVPRNDDRWTVTGSVPGAFSVHHVCRSDHSQGC